VTSDFREVLKAAVRDYPSQQALADAIGVSAARLNRALNKGDHPFNVENCLRLAKVTGAKPSPILHAAGKGDVAELIEGLYGEQVDSTLTIKERDHLDRWRQLDAERQRAIDVLTRDRPETTSKSRRALNRRRQ
jgi:transcriptional regulator with XRE-family HTH domain